MTKIVKGARIVHKRITTTPTISSIPDHTLGWLTTDIYEGELCLDLNHIRAYTRMDNASGTTGGGIVEFVLIDPTTEKIRYDQLPTSILGGVIYKGTWNASTNYPYLSGFTGTNGWYYVVTVSGNTNLGGITDWKVSDWAIYQEDIGWQKVDNTEDVIDLTPYLKKSGDTMTGTLIGTNIGLSGNIFVSGMSSSTTTNVVFYNSITGKLTYGSIPTTAPSGLDGYIQFNSGGSFSSSSKLKYDGVNLYLSGATNTITDNVVYYDVSNGKLTYGIKPSGTTTPASGLDSYVQINSGGTFGSTSKFKYDGTDLYLSGMTSNGTSYVLFYDTSTGKLTYGNKPNYISLGTFGQIPYVNNLDNDFIYSSNFAWNSGGLMVGGGTSSSNVSIYPAGGGQNAISGVSNIAIGENAFYNSVNGGDYNTVIGYQSGMQLSGSNCAFFGAYSGMYETESNRLIVDSLDRGSELNGRNYSLIYGVFDSILDNQYLKVNGNLYVSGMSNDSSQPDVVYYNSSTGKLSYGTKPTSGSASLPTGSTPEFSTTITVDSYPTSKKFAVYHYCIYSGSTNLRAGTITLVNDNTTLVQINDVSTMDIGTTAGVEFSGQNNGSNVDLLVSASSGDWKCDWIKIII